MYATFSYNFSCFFLKINLYLHKHSWYFPEKGSIFLNIFVLCDIDSFFYEHSIFDLEEIAVRMLHKSFFLTIFLLYSPKLCSILNFKNYEAVFISLLTLANIICFIFMHTFNTCVSFCFMFFRCLHIFCVIIQSESDGINKHKM